ncbi:A24 family peptidase [Cohnella sp. JJ-181]|uniref:A24 family peptidase n=1 Tax=Cohnella rhizoplanae TaxID=2974897 RepID=UPI0022FF6844|nr:A24 family peptidase [Cohnella sp. JJ-181]CAI6079137.1 hypothetical protein COHCIP112018_02723 [Cohnella sp. JJ-181]
MHAFVTTATAVLLLCACWTDIRRMEIPNILCLVFAAGGFVFQLAAAGSGGVWFALGGFATGLVPLWLLHAAKGLGAGDVKWFAAFGVWAGASAVLQLAAASMLIAGAIAVVLLSCRIPLVRPWALKLRWPWGIHPAHAGKGAKFPFMLAVAPAYALLAWNGG